MDYKFLLPGNMPDEKQILENLRPSKARKQDGFFPDMSSGATTMVKLTETPSPVTFGGTTCFDR